MKLKSTSRNRGIRAARHALLVMPLFGLALMMGKAAQADPVTGAGVTTNIWASSIDKPNFLDMYEIKRDMVQSSSSFLAFGHEERLFSSYANPNPDPIKDPTRAFQNEEWTMALKRRNGSYFGAGKGDGANAISSFNTARWKKKTAFSDSDNTVSGSLLGLSGNTRFSTFAVDLNKRNRVAVSTIKSKDSGASAIQGVRPSAQGTAASYTLQPAKNWTFSLSSSFLKESGMMLGSVNNDHFTLGKTTTMSVGFGGSVNLGHGYSFGIDSIIASTSPSQSGDDSAVSASRLTSYGVSFAMSKDDMGFSIQKPLKVYSGSAIVDGDKINLAPSGSETDFRFNFKHDWDSRGTGSFSLSYRDDADHVSGAKDIAAMVRFTASF